MFDHSIPINTYSVSWFIVIPSCWILQAIAYRLFNLWATKSRKGSRTSDLLAFNFTCGLLPSSFLFFLFQCRFNPTFMMAMFAAVGLAVTYFSIAGLVAFFGSTWTRLGSDKFYARDSFVENHLLLPMLIYQVWNTVFCISLKEMRDFSMIGP